MDLLVTFLTIVGLLTVVAILFAMIWLSLGQPMDEHWPRGLDEDQLLDVQNHRGDSRPVNGRTGGLL